MRRARAFLAVSAFSAFALQFALMDGLMRGAAAYDASAAVSSLASGAAWCLLALLATSRPRRIALGVTAAALSVVSVSVFRFYHVPLDVQVAASALHAWADVRPVLVRALPSLLAFFALASAVEIGLLELAQARPRAVAPWLRLRRSAPALVAVTAAGTAFGAPPRRATPEVRAVHALGAVLDRAKAAKDEAVGSAALPVLHAERPELPSVLFILTESVRADDYVSSGSQATAPETAAVTPRRVDLTELRSVSSYTAVSLSAILTARSQEGARADILRAPNLFDFVHAARDAHGRRPSVAYYSAQSREVFETKDVRAAVDRFVTFETMTGHGPEESEDDPRTANGVDAMIVDRFEADVRTLPLPSLAVLHLADTHAPYVVDPARAPFQPVDHVVAWSRLEKLHNAYKDAIYKQDALVARAVRAFVARAGDGPWLVVFTSDHGEAFGEHGAIHHGQNLFEEQVHVPAWIAWGGGALDAAQARVLESNRAAFSTHLDLLPTVLDALGLWDNFAVAPHRAAMRGDSLLRARGAARTVPATNCTGMFPCPLNTWGLYRGDRKLLARIYDGDFTCFVVGGGSERRADAGDLACDRLRAESRRTFPLLPNGAPNR